MLGNIFIRAFLLLSLSSSWADVLADILGHQGTNGDAPLYSFLVTLAIFHVVKSLPSFAWHPSSLYSLW